MQSVVMVVRVGLQRTDQAARPWSRSKTANTTWRKEEEDVLELQCVANMWMKRRGKRRFSEVKYLNSLRNTYTSEALTSRE